MEIVKISIILNGILIFLFFLLLIYKLSKVFLKSNNIFQQYFITDNGKSILKKFQNLLVSNKLVILFLFISISLSILRAFFVDPPIIVTDGYDYYAENMKILITDWSYNIDNLIHPGTYNTAYLHKYRIVYSLLIAIISLSFPNLSIIFIGRMISLISFLISCILIVKILRFFNLINNKENNQAILAFFILNTTIVTNLIRFETDIIFLAFSLYLIYLYLKIIKKNSKPIDILLLAICILLLFFTREVGIVLFIALVIHFFYIQSTKTKLSVVTVLLIAIIILSIFGIFQTLMYYTIWAATLSDIAYDIVYNLSIKVLVEHIFNKFTNSYILLKTIESLTYAFIPGIIFGCLGFFSYYKRSKKKGKILLNLLGIYFMLYLLIYLILKIGRGLDRFWIPIQIFPNFLIPFSPSFKEIKNSIILYFSNLKKRITKKGTINYQNNIVKQYNSNEKPTISLGITITILSFQLLFYILRFCLAMFGISFN